MPVGRAVSAVLVTLACGIFFFILMVLLRSTPETVQETINLSLARPAILVIGVLTCAGAIFILFPKTFFTANLLSSAVVLYLAAEQSRAHNLRGVLLELPFVFLPLFVLFLGYPFKHQS